MYEHAGQSRVRESVRYITYDSCAISVVPPFNNKISLCHFNNIVYIFQN